jgi:hypothetical protein
MVGKIDICSFLRPFKSKAEDLFDDNPKTGNKNLNKLGR